MASGKIKILSPVLDFDLEHTTASNLSDEKITALQEEIPIETALFEQNEQIEVSFAGIEWNGIVFRNCHFQDCDFQRCHFSNVWFDCCDFSNCSLRETKFHRCRFTGCKAIGAGFEDSRWEEVTFDVCNFSYANFSGCYQDTVLFTRGTLDGAVFQECRLKHWEVAQVSLISCEFFRTPLKGIDFTSCCLERIIISETYQELRAAIMTREQAAQLAQEVFKIVLE